MPLISVIIPLYNAEKYIKACLDSLEAQTLKDFEVIVVDDCSTDRSVEIVEGMNEKFGGRLHLLKREKNSGGAAVPRNDALKIAVGKYIFFLDADDLILPNALKTVYDIAESTGSDFVHAERCFRPDNFEEITPQTKFITFTMQKDQCIDKPTFEPDDIGERVKHFSERKMWWIACNNLFRRDLIVDNRIEFINIKSTEDMIFFFSCLCCAKKYIRIPDIFYVYRQTPGSITHPTVSVEKYVESYASILINGVKAFDEFADRLDFFIRHPEFKYMAIDYYIKSNLEWNSWAYAANPAPVFYATLRRKFSEIPSANVLLTTYLFGLANDYWLESARLKNENATLKNQLKLSLKGQKNFLRTWDVFDTLIARRCVQPIRIFELVEQKIGVKGFAKMRVQAEQIILKLGIDYKFDDIYDVMHQLMKIDKPITDQWKQVELDVEFEQAVPIVENINQVRADDVLISDMYLPEKTIRRLLKKCGLLEPVEIVVSTSGKASGRVYRRFQEQGVYLFHTGDNEISDVAKPREFGMESSWTVLSRPTPLETQLLKIDFDFGAYLRELRLANPFDEEVRRKYWSLFVINVGALMLIAQLIDKVLKAYGFEYLGFCGRDTYYMRQLYQRLKSDRNEPEPANNYLYYSRKLVQNCADDMVKYFSQEIKNRRALMIDLRGSGQHLEILRKKSGLNYSVLICILLLTEKKLLVSFDGNIFELFANKMNVKDIPAMQNDKAPLNLYMFDCVKDKLPPGDETELFNRATHNSPIRLKVIETADKIIPNVVFSEVNDTVNLDVFEACMKVVLQSEIQWSKFERTEDLLSMLKMLLTEFGILAKQFGFKEQHDINEASDNLAGFINSKNNRKS